MTLEAVEFIRRFLLHVLPAGFVRIRHYGFLANRVCREKLALCRDPAGGRRRPTRRGRARLRAEGGRRRAARGARLPRLRRGPDGDRRDLAGDPGQPERRVSGSRSPSGRDSIRPEPSARGGCDRMNHRRRDRPPEVTVDSPSARAGSRVPNPGIDASRSPIGRRGRHPSPAPRRPNAAISLRQRPSPRGTALD